MRLQKKREEAVEAWFFEPGLTARDVSSIPDWVLAGSTLRFAVGPGATVINRIDCAEDTVIPGRWAIRCGSSSAPPGRGFWGLKADAFENFYELVEE